LKSNLCSHNGCPQAAQGRVCSVCKQEYCEGHLYARSANIGKILPRCEECSKKLIEQELAEGTLKIINQAFAIGVDGVTLHFGDRKIFYPTPSLDSGFERA